MSKTVVKVAHLYGDIMNVYGDWGNILALKYRAQQRQISLQVDTIGPGQQWQPGQYQLYFFGGGQDESQSYISSDVQRISPILQQDIKNGVPLLAICGGYQMLGRSYLDSSGQRMDGAGVLPIETVAGQGRLVGNIALAVNPKLNLHQQNATIVGFENHSGQTFLDADAQPLGRVIKGQGNNGQDGTEGVIVNHAIGSYLHGSLLPKNPHLADWLLQKALDQLGTTGSLSPLDDALEWQAHRQALQLKA